MSTFHCLYATSLSIYTFITLITFLAPTLALPGMIPGIVDGDTGQPVDIVPGEPDRPDAASWHRDPPPNYMIFQYRRFDENDCEKEMSIVPRIAIAPARSAHCTTMFDGVARSLELVPQGWHNFGRLGELPERDAKCVMYGFTEEGCKGKSALFNRWVPYNCYYFPTNMYWTKWATIKSFNISCPGLDNFHGDLASSSAWIGGDQNGDQSHKGRHRANMVPPRNRPHPHPNGTTMADNSSEVTWIRTAGEVAPGYHLVDEDGDYAPEVADLATHTDDGKNGELWRNAGSVVAVKNVTSAKERKEVVS